MADYLNHALERREVECYEAYLPHADHRIEAVEVPYGDRTVSGCFHLPPGYSEGERLSYLVMVSGVDAFKDFQIGGQGDRFLRRGFAVLMLDGPGQGTCLTRGIRYDPDRQGELGTAAFVAVAARPVVDPARIMMWGLSFDS